MTDAVGRVLSGRGAGTALNDDGCRQAAALARCLRGRAFTGILSSPQLRARQTAEAIASGEPVTTEPALDEIDFGAWTGQTFDALSDAPGWAGWNTHRSLAHPPGAETMAQAQARAAALLPHLHARHPGGSFVLVTHADIVKSVLALVLGMPIDLMQRLEIAPASRSTIVLHDGDARVEAVNLLP